MQRTPFVSVGINAIEFEFMTNERWNLSFLFSPPCFDIEQTNLDQSKRASMASIYLSWKQHVHQTDVIRSVRFGIEIWTWVFPYVFFQSASQNWWLCCRLIMRFFASIWAFCCKKSWKDESAAFLYFIDVINISLYKSYYQENSIYDMISL